MKIAVVVLLAVVASAVTEGAFVGYNRPMSEETLALVEEVRAQAELLEQTGRPSNRLPFGPDMLEALRPKTEETNSAE